MTRDERIWRMYKILKRKGRFYYGDYGSPYLPIARAFKLPIRHVREVIDDQRAYNIATQPAPGIPWAQRCVDKDCDRCV